MAENFAILLTDIVNYPFLKMSYFSTQLQPAASMKCGLYVLFFVHYSSHHGLPKFVNIYQSVFSKKNLQKNDSFVTSYYFSHMNKKKSCRRWKTGSNRAITFKECSSIGELL